MNTANITFEPEDALMLLGSLINEHRAALKRSVSIGFAVRDWGTWVLDSKSADVVSPGWREGLDVQILCNREALSDFALGRLDLERPGGDHIFILSGDRGALGALRDAFSGSKSWLDLRASQSRND